MPLFGHAGLALSVSLGATINAVWLFAGLKRGGWYQPAPGWGRFALKVVFATLAMSALLALPPSTSTGSASPAARASRVAWLAGCLGAAAVVYFGVLLAAGMRPRDFSRRV